MKKLRHYEKIDTDMNKKNIVSRISFFNVSAIINNMGMRSVDGE